MSDFINKLKESDSTSADMFAPFEELLNLPDEEFDKTYPSFKSELEKLLTGPEIDKIIYDSAKTAGYADIEKEKEALEEMLKEIADDDSLSENKKDLLITIFKTTINRGFTYMANPRERISVKILKMNDDAVIPSYAHDTDAGADVYSCEDITIEAGETKLVHTGLKFEIPSGYEVQVRPRSGNSLKTKIRIANTPGTIDSNYRGELGVIVDNTGTEPINITKGFKIAQILIAPTPMMEFTVVDKLANSDRGEGGYGSTDKS